MINELVDKIGKDVIEKGYLDGIVIKNALAIKVKSDGTIEHIEFDNLEDNYEGLDEKDFYIDRYKYSMNLGLKNKEVVTSGLGARALISCNEYGLIFNYNTIKAKLDTINESKDKTEKKERDKFKKARGYKLSLTLDELFNIMFEDYFIKLEREDCILNKYRKEICEYIIQNEASAIDKKIIILEDRPVEDYKKEYEIYLSSAIVNKAAKIGEYKGYDLFSTLNASKPLLASVGTGTSYTNLNKEEDIVLFYKLYKYIIGNKKKIKQLELGIELEIDKSNIYIANYDPESFLNYSDDLQSKILLSYIKSGEVEEKIIASKTDIVNELNKFMGFAITTDSKIKSKSILHNRYKKLILYKVEKEKQIYYKVDMKMLKNKVTKLFDDILEFNRLDKENNNSSVRLRNILEFKFKLEAYLNLNNERVERMKEIQEGFKNKIINIKDEISIDSRDELMFITGQLAAYISNKSKSKTVKERMLSKYHKVRSFERLFKLLDLDKGKYSFDNSYRENKVFSAIISELGKGQMTVEERIWYFTGLYSDNMFFTKKLDITTNN
ncbi:MAG: hypothetical protein ACRCWG_06125 [Sarcina sp.]